MEKASNSDDAQNYPQWEGLHGLRSTGIGIVSGGDFEAADEWVDAIGLPGRLPGESWFDWSQRTNQNQPAGTDRSGGQLIRERVMPLANLTLDELRAKAAEAAAEADVLSLSAIIADAQVRQAKSGGSAELNEFIDACRYQIGLILEQEEN